MERYRAMRWRIMLRRNDGFSWVTVLGPMDDVPRERDGEVIEVVPASQLEGAVTENERLGKALREVRMIASLPILPGARRLNMRFDAIDRIAANALPEAEPQGEAHKKSEVERLRAALRDVYSLLEGFRCLNVLDAPVADLDGARERVRAALEEVETA